MEKYKGELKKQIEKLDIMINDKQEEQFILYMKELIEWNKKINLTAITVPEEIIIKHFVDSLTIAQYIKEDDKIIDVGTGAGFPGIPIKIVKEKTEVTLLDSLNKRIQFLEDIIEKNKLERINAIHYRAEDAGIDRAYREKYDIATSRAVASLNILVEYMLPFVKIGGKCICMKGSEIKEELEKSKKAIEILGGEIEKVEEFQIPETDITRNIIIIKKIKETPKAYPRKAGIPTKKPL